MLGYSAKNLTNPFTVQGKSLTEFVPEDEFIPNLDQPTGICSRLARGIQSGIVLTKEPFSLKVKNERTICTTREPLGLVITIVYEMLDDV